MIGQKAGNAETSQGRPKGPQQHVFAPAAANDKTADEPVVPVNQDGLADFADKRG